MSKIIKVLGTGCPNCQKTIRIVGDVVKENNIDATIEKVEDIQNIMKYNVMSTPAVVVDEEVKFSGRVPSRKEINEILEN